MFCHFAGVEHSVVSTQRQRGKTSAIILQKRLLLPVNLGRVTKPFLNNLKSIIPQVKSIQDCSQPSHLYTPSKFTPSLAVLRKIKCQFYDPAIRKKAEQVCPVWWGFQENASSF